MVRVLDVSGWWVVMVDQSMILQDDDRWVREVRLGRPRRSVFSRVLCC